MSKSTSHVLEDEIDENNEIISDLVMALRAAMRTVQCDSVIIEGPDAGKDHIWYRMAVKAIARAEGR